MPRFKMLCFIKEKQKKTFMYNAIKRFKFRKGRRIEFREGKVKMVLLYFVMWRFS